MANTDLDHRLLRTFCAVADELHFRRAAQRLHATTSAVSSQVQELERRVGVPLLRRNRRLVELTAAGEAFRHEAGDLLQRADDAVIRAREAARGRVGTIAFGFIGAATFEALPMLMREIAHDSPDLSFRFGEMTGREQVRALVDGAIDLGLVRAGTRAAGLEAKPLMQEPVVCLLPRGHRLSAREHVRIGDLDGERILNLSRAYDAAAHDFYVGLYRKAGFEPDIVFEACELATIQFMIATAGCVALGPAGWRVLMRPDVVLRPLEAPAPKVGTHVVWNPKRVTPALDVALAAADRMAAARAS